MDISINIDIPPRIMAGLSSGNLTRDGSVVRNLAGRIVAHLKESPAPAVSEDMVDATAHLLMKSPKAVVIAGLATLAVVTAGVIVRNRKRTAPECVKNCSDSLRAYLEAVRDQSLDTEIIDRLIADLDALTTSGENDTSTISLPMKQCETLVQAVIDHTRQQAQVNSIELDEPSTLTPASADAPIVDLRRHLEAQRRILTATA